MKYYLVKFQMSHYAHRVLSLCWDIVENHCDKAVSMNRIVGPFV